MGEPSKPDAELELLQEIQARLKDRRLAALTIIRRGLDLPIDAHLEELARDIAGRKERQ